MSLRTIDMDRDGDLDILTSDRKGALRGVRWLENPGPGLAQSQPWTSHLIAGADKEVMFLTTCDFDKDNQLDVVAAVKPREILCCRRESTGGKSWDTFSIPFPPNTGTAKGIAVGDIDQDGKLDIVLSCENADDGASGVVWLSYRTAFTDTEWDAHEISGPDGVKFDRIELVDIDADTDLDVVTCEERTNLGVIWYENPTVICFGMPETKAVEP